VTGGDAAIMLKVGEKVLQQTSKADVIQFDKIKLIKGEVKLEAIRSEDGKDVGAYQLLVTTDASSASS